MHVTLTVIAGPHEGRSFTFMEHDNFIVGRSKRAHFPMEDDKYFSRRHFMVEVNPPQCRIIDLDSRNGTVVNGQKVPTADLKDGDQIQGGRTIMRVNVVADPEDSAPPLETLSPPVNDSAALETLSPPREAASSSQAKPVVSEEPKPSFSRAAFFPAVQIAEPVVAATPCPACGGQRFQGSALCKQCEDQARLVPQPIPPYRLIRELGKGAMGVVHLAVRETDGIVVAVKTITPAVASSPKEIDRFLREARILKQLDHPNIVAFRDMGEACGQLFFAMDYVRGSDALHLLKKHKALPIPMAVRIICQVLDALAYAHTKGIVHRDIKPANLLLASPAASEAEAKAAVQVVKLADFGLAKTYQASRLSGLTMLGDPGGTPLYMPPEQVENFRNAQPSADQYGAAAVLYHLLTGKPIFDNIKSVPQLFSKILGEEPVPIAKRRPEITPGLADVIHRALAKEPRERFTDVKAMRKELQQFAS